ncbi:MAG: poly(R)-hydroxyalkanoic acid synthase subunit PhaE [Deltaproteobacteria bacterium]
MSEQKFDYTENYKKFYESWQKTMSEAVETWMKSPFLNNPADGGAAKPSEFDPVAQYKKFYETWEKTTSEAMEAWLKSPLFAASMGKAIEKSSDVKKYLDEVMEKSLKNMHFPTKNDIDRVLASINNVEAKINDLWDKVEDLKKQKAKSSPNSN